MAVIRTDEDLIAELEPVVDGLGFRIVEAKQARVRGTLHVAVVIYGPDGVSVDACAQVSRTLMPRLELLFSTQDIALEVGSPGIDRKIKDNREFEIFTGRGVQVLLIDSDEWIGGTIDAVDALSVTISGGFGSRSVPFEKIQKAKLDEAQEVR